MLEIPILIKHTLLTKINANLEFMILIKLLDHLNLLTIQDPIMIPIQVFDTFPDSICSPYILLHNLKVMILIQRINPQLYQNIF